MNTNENDCYEHLRLFQNRGSTHFQLFKLILVVLFVVQNFCLTAVKTTCSKRDRYISLFSFFGLNIISTLFSTHCFRRRLNYF